MSFMITSLLSISLNQNFHFRIFTSRNLNYTRFILFFFYLGTLPFIFSQEYQGQNSILYFEVYDHSIHLVGDILNFRAHSLHPFNFYYTH
ncbi:hypothetical protein HMI56_006576 [Coelomomyces lativittatus]|nr:hypothetical protein HMI56_006576 [Coelomomyces lativittatus]